MDNGKVEINRGIDLYKIEIIGCIIKRKGGTTFEKYKECI